MIFVSAVREPCRSLGSACAVSVPCSRVLIFVQSTSENGTGTFLRTFGPDIAGVMGTNERIPTHVQDAATETEEPRVVLTTASPARASSWWLPRGPTSYVTRLLSELALQFMVSSPDREEHMRSKSSQDVLSCPSR